VPQASFGSYVMCALGSWAARGTASRCLLGPAGETAPGSVAMRTNGDDIVAARVGLAGLASWVGAGRIVGRAAR